jgi:regulation of enolase protein 1 (concanavalin A-like superfamily)
MRRQHCVMKGSLLALLFVLLTSNVFADEVLFQENFTGKLKDDWSWRREHKEAWRIEDGALRVRIEPGNMWGPANDAKNVLVRDLPTSTQALEVSITVSNQPTEQYEQVDLTCYFDDSHMVKIGFERVDGKRCIVMGREEKDRTRTIAIIPVNGPVIELRYVTDGKTFRGSFRDTGVVQWREAGTCDLPVNGNAKLAIQCYQGPGNAEHWARISNVIVRALDAK